MGLSIAAKDMPQESCCAARMRRVGAPGRTLQAVGRLKLIAGALLAAFAFAQSAPCRAAGDPTPDIGVGAVRTLESFAAELGVRLGAEDDGPVFAAANRAIVAAKDSGGLAVALPPGRVERTSIGLLLDNNGGYFCIAPGRCTVRAVRPSASAEPTWLVSVNDAHATNLILSGIVFYGGWQYGRAPYRDMPEADPWLDKQGGVNISHAFNGTGDRDFISRSTVGSQVPRDHIENLVISGFAGDCLVVSGAGQNSYHNVRGQACGGRGMVIDSYDNKFTDIDFGVTGRTCLHIDGQGAANVVHGKVWYCGFRLKPGDDEGLNLLSGGDIIELIVQDTYGDGIRNSGQLNLITAVVSWQGALSPMDPGPIAAYTCVGCGNNIVTLNASILGANQAYPNVTRLYRDASNGAHYGRNNIVTISEMGWPQDYSTSVWKSFWFDGPVDLSNRITLNGVDRHRYDEADSSGMLAYAAPMNGSGAGTIIFGSGSSNPGKVVVICQGGGNSSCGLQGFRNTASPAVGILRVNGNFAGGDQVMIGDATYTFDVSLANTPGHVHLGATGRDSLANLASAINAAGGRPGVDYAQLTVPNAGVTASLDGRLLAVTARIAGTDGNRIAVATTSAKASWRRPTLAGGTAGAKTYSSALTWDEDGRPGMPNLPGPYDDDATAAAAGVAMGQLYRDRSAVVHVRIGAAPAAAGNRPPEQRTPRSGPAPHGGR